jgi:PAS domain S-box-containing protein
VDATIVPFLNEQGKPRQYVAIRTDITARKRAEETLGASEVRYRRLFEAARDGILILNAETGTVVDVNPYLVELLGYSREAFLGKKVWELGFFKDILANQNNFTELQQEGYVRYEDRPLETSDGRRIEVEFVSNVYQAGDETVIQCNIRNITERKHAQDETRRLNAELEQHVVVRTAELATANKELEAFSYSVSHDLRAPLRGLDGFSQALLEDYGDKLGDEGQHLLQRIRAGSQRMGQLIDDLLNLSRVSRSELRREPVNLSGLAGDIVEELRSHDPHRDVALRITEDLTADGDPQLLRVVLENLLGNAWKYTARRPHATIEFGLDRDNGHSSFFVRDDGVGFDMQYADKLFTPFQRLHGTNEFPGTGVGLASVQRIIHRHGGRVWAQAEVNKGATFHFTLS